MRFSIATLIFLQICLLAGPPVAGAAADRPPNLVLLIGDDHGWPYSGFMGDGAVRTPNLDALAASGTTFVNAHSPSSLCQPALRALLAGVHTEQWERRRDLLERVFGELPTRSEVQYYRTVPRELARAGYLAWEGGKLWEGTFATAGFTHGLATFLSPSWYSSAGDDFGRAGWRDGSALAPLDAFLDEARGRPFFLWIAPMLPHVPYDAPPEFAAPYAGTGLSAEESSYFANVSWLDAVIGNVVATLDRRGLRDDTLIVYLSDNGKDAAVPGAGVGLGKGTLHELGFRTPLVLSWPGHVDAGVVRHDLVSTLDVPATLLDYGGAAPIRDLEGRSLRDAIDSGRPVGRDRLVGRFRSRLPADDGWWVRTPDWRYLVTTGGHEEMYAIAADPFETRDLAREHPDLLRRFRNDVRAWQQRLDVGRATVEVTGRVADADGSPLPGETLELAGRSGTGRLIRLRVLTSRGGDFAFASVPQGFYVLTSRRRDAALALGGVAGPIPVPLPPGSIDAYLPLEARAPAAARTAGDGTIDGIVRGPDAEPVPGATVRLRGVGGTRTSTVVVRTGPDGRWRAEHLPAGAYRVTAGGPRVRAGARVNVAPDDVRTIDLPSRRPHPPGGEGT